MTDQFRYIKIQPKTVDLSTRLWGITTEFVGCIPESLMLRSVVLGLILLYQTQSVGLELILKCTFEQLSSELLDVHI